MTNDKALRKLIKEVNASHPLLSAVLRERILHIMDLTMQSIKQEPSKWENPLIHPNVYKILNDVVQETIGFDK